MFRVAVVWVQQLIEAVIDSRNANPELLGESKLSIQNLVHHESKHELRECNNGDRVLLSVCKIFNGATRFVYESLFNDVFSDSTSHTHRLC